MERALLVSREGAIHFQTAEYDSELEMQELIKANASLINISSIFDSDILVVGRETWKIDVLAISSTGVPIIVETKRKDNKDMRYLIAQVFEYASLLNSKTYGEFEAAATKYFSSERCTDARYRGKTFAENYASFCTENGNDDFLEDGEFQSRIAENLESGQFYCVMVVDELDSTTRRAIDFFNSKLNKLRIEVIEVKKMVAENMQIFVPIHANPETPKRQDNNRPGRITYAEMLKNGTEKQMRYVTAIVNQWCEYENCSFEMGTTGLSLRFKEFSIFWLFLDKLHIANPLARQLERNRKSKLIYDNLKNMMQGKFEKGRLIFENYAYDLPVIMTTLSEIYQIARKELA